MVSYIPGFEVLAATHNSWITLSNRMTANNRLAIAAALINPRITNRSRLEVLLIVAGDIYSGTGYANLCFCLCCGTTFGEGAVCRISSSTSSVARLIVAGSAGSGAVACCGFAALFFGAIVWSGCRDKVSEMGGVKLIHSWHLLTSWHAG
jgi:hypothetical protein